MGHVFFDHPVPYFLEHPVHCKTTCTHRAIDGDLISTLLTTHVGIVDRFNFGFGWFGRGVAVLRALVDQLQRFYHALVGEEKLLREACAQHVVLAPRRLVPVL